MRGWSTSRVASASTRWWPVCAVFIATLMLPIEVLVIPLFIGANELNAVNTYSMVILPFAFGAFGTFLLRQFLL
ncbi:hypothetical protein [Tessaracoccus massiliensis]|uniref:hypothetical protein n=1 Tax=Tessaracoccus massiliensis TaxID=1522311 RepID=UPI001C56F336|nr:hypothetical protein [Tessaracoccus massiliensis]